MSFREKIILLVQAIALCAMIGPHVFEKHEATPEEIRISQLSESLDREMEKNPKIKQLSDELDEAIEDQVEPPDQEYPGQ